jgi:hypothetical protein
VEFYHAQDFIDRDRAWLALTGAASAAMVSLTPGPMDPQYFASEVAGQNGFTINGATWTNAGGTAETEKGSLANVYAAPLGMGTSTITGTAYMAIEGGGTEMATFATPQTSISIYWGSIDNNPGNMNSFAVSIDGYTLTGSDLVALGALGDGSQTDPQANQLVTITGLWRLYDCDVLFDQQCVRVQPCYAHDTPVWRCSGAVDLGDDGRRICRTWLCGVPPELERSGARHLISSVSKPMQGAAAGRPSLFADGIPASLGNPRWRRARARLAD